jgi:enoyl-CoA hydratase/carnithine racemase
MEMISEFKAEVDAIARDSSISVVVIAGNGPRSRAVTI